jgi:hypothetical protein
MALRDALGDRDRPENPARFPWAALAAISGLFFRFSRGLHAGRLTYRLKN